MADKIATHNTLAKGNRMNAATRTGLLMVLSVVAQGMQSVGQAEEVDRKIVEQIIERQKIYRSWKTLYIDAVYDQKTPAWTKYERCTLRQNSQGLKRSRIEKGSGTWSAEKPPESVEEWIDDGNVSVRTFRGQSMPKPAKDAVRLSPEIDVFDTGRLVPARNPYDQINLGDQLEVALRNGDIDKATRLEDGIVEIVWKQRTPDGFLIRKASIDVNAPVIPRTMSSRTENRKGDLLFSTSATFDRDRDVFALKAVSDTWNRMPVDMDAALDRLRKDRPAHIETMKLETAITVIEARFDAEEDLEPRTFLIEIPVGTNVEDHRTGRTFTVRGMPLFGKDLKK